MRRPVTRDDAEMLVAVLVAAFPSPLVPKATRALTIEQLTKWRDLEAAAAAVDAIIENEDRWPSVALLLREYRPRAKRNAERFAQERGLEASPPDAAENARQARALLERLTNDVETRAAKTGLPNWNGNGDKAEP
jgi:hypothetical protein